MKGLSILCLSLSRDCSSQGFTHFYFFFSTQRGKMWPWIASLLSQSFDKKVKKKKYFCWLFLKLKATYNISHLRSCLALSLCSVYCKWMMHLCICILFFYVVYWNGKLNWFQVCVWVRQSAFFLFGVYVLGVKLAQWLMLFRRWVRVCVFVWKREDNKSGTSFYMNLPCCSAQTLTYHFNFILIHKRPIYAPSHTYLCISTHWHAHRSVATVTP